MERLDLLLQRKSNVEQDLKPGELISEITVKNLPSFPPRSVRRSLAVRPSAAPPHPSPSRFRSSCGPNGKENTDSPFRNPPRWVPNLAGGCVKAREHTVSLRVSGREERREGFTHFSLLPVVPHSLLSEARSNTEWLPLWVCSTVMPSKHFFLKKPSGLIFPALFM